METMTQVQAKEHPILFSAPMVRAILEGRKTMTRRVVKFHKSVSEHSWWMEAHEIGPAEFIFWSGPQKVDPGFTKSVYKAGDGIRCPYGIPGDRLWVRETHAWIEGDSPSDYETGSGWIYRASLAPEHDDGLKWKPSIFMPRLASRILLEVVSVRVERLQDITRSDIKAEGLVCPSELHSDDLEYNYRQWYIDEWIRLWKSINGPESWEQNPWVWVIGFKRV